LSPAQKQVRRPLCDPARAMPWPLGHALTPAFRTRTDQR
jgi:hypothetical protein